MTAGHESAAAATAAIGDDAARLRLIIAGKKWVGFDLDDTLHEFRRASSAAAGQVFDAISQRYALSAPQLKAAYSEILREKTAGAFADGKTSFDYRRIRFSALLAHFSVQPDDAFLETLLQLYESALTASLELKAGAVGLLSKIKRSGRKVVIITEGPQDAQERTVEALGIRPYVDHLATTNFFKDSKVGQLFPKVLDHLSISPEDIVYIGDSAERDMGPATAAGIFSIHYVEGEEALLGASPPRINSLAWLEDVF